MRSAGFFNFSSLDLGRPSLFECNFPLIQLTLKPKIGVILPKFLRQSVPLRDTTFCSKRFLSVLRVRNKTPFEGLTIRPSVRMLQTDFRLCRRGFWQFTG